MLKPNALQPGKKYLQRFYSEKGYLYVSREGKRECMVSAAVLHII